MALSTEEKQEIIVKFAQVKGDTGSPEIQIALLSFEIEKLQKHLGENKHDYPGKRGLLTKIAKRRRLLRYLTKHEVERYKKLIKKLGLKK
ncbi:30S ribosomal protein S15 [Patescibacteria group bacterium]|nr:30S ribosomal protein S15 [Patescibacteria group bacterium]MCG2701565.1 30S ribosomal protein S15 [Candidatus Parcubacteria bacterium]MBU4210277.1 30S ribosomal protein S15 [Patescibacteria group bacterium]MBU4264467.1 30S ribosomal protein S15 [Patescibacteria group bacterium]MBU4390398.1 30S ribosomal protein S15 [Patescibacteria group bacterium]